MKKNLKNVSKILGVFIMLTSCASESLDIPNQDAASIKAKMWFDTSKPNLKVLDYTNTIDWNNSITSNGNKGTIIEVPLTLKGDIEAKVGDEKALKTFHRLMFIPDEKERYKAYHVLITTNDKTFDSKSKAFNFYKLNTGFNGYITVVNSKNEITDFDNYQDLKLVSKPKTNKLTPNTLLTCVYYGYLDENDDFHRIYLVGCFEDSGLGGGGETTYGGEGGTGGGSGSASTSTGTAAIVVVGPSKEIMDINDYLRCFDLSQNATLIIYVDQPIPNSPNAYSLSGDVGHTFIALQQGGVRRVLGYWPKTSVHPALSPTDVKAFGNDENHFFDVNLSTQISATQLLNIVGYINSVPRTYDLNNYNCSDFGIEVGRLGGLNLPDCYGSWPYGGGSNPGTLGQYIRTMQLPATSYRQTTGTNSASNNGTCN